MIYDVIDVCQHCINYSNKTGFGISNLKLQKILYFVQAYFLISTEDHHPCFYERIEAWEFGPVVPVAYMEYAKYGFLDILSISTEDDMISREDRIRIDKVLDAFSWYTASDLTTLSMKQLPWIRSYVKDRNNEISLDLMRDFFK